MATLLPKRKIPGVGTSVAAEEILEEVESAWAKHRAGFI